MKNTTRYQIIAVRKSLKDGKVEKSEPQVLVTCSEVGEVAAIEQSHIVLLGMLGFSYYNSTASTTTLLKIEGDGSASTIHLHIKEVGIDELENC